MNSLFLDPNYTQGWKRVLNPIINVDIPTCVLNPPTPLSDDFWDTSEIVFQILNYTLQCFSDLFIWALTPFSVFSRGEGCFGELFLTSVRSCLISIRWVKLRRDKGRLSFPLLLYRSSFFPSFSDDFFRVFIKMEEDKFEGFFLLVVGIVFRYILRICSILLDFF